VSYLVVVGITFLIVQKVSKSSLVIPYLYIWPASLVFDTVFLILLSLTGQPVFSMPILKTVMFPAATYNLILMLLVHPSAAWIRSRFRQEPVMGT